MRELRVSRDGSRVALIVGTGSGSRLLLARVEWDDHTARLAAPTPLSTDFTQVMDVAWRDGDSLAVLGKDVQGVLLPYLVNVDGTNVSATASPGAATSIAAAPGEPMLAGLKGRQVWASHDDLTWQRLDDGSEPVYPG